MLTLEQKAALCEDYKDRRNRVGDIAQKYGIMRASVARIAVEMGAEPRRANVYGKKQTKTQKRICPKCKKTIDVKGASFCCFCGTDIRSNKEKLIRRIENAFADISFMPQSRRDDMQHLFIDIINELKE
jgi:tRNA(Ile2) C34 agmatinyltransferase TiaS